jgi:hypothetical protein
VSTTHIIHHRIRGQRMLHYWALGHRPKKEEEEKKKKERKKNFPSKKTMIEIGRDYMLHL